MQYRAWDRPRPPLVKASSKPWLATQAKTNPNTRVRGGRKPLQRDHAFARARSRARAATVDAGKSGQFDAVVDGTRLTLSVLPGRAKGGVLRSSALDRSPILRKVRATEQAHAIGLAQNLVANLAPSAIRRLRTSILGNTAGADRAASRCTSARRAAGSLAARGAAASGFTAGLGAATGLTA